MSAGDAALRVPAGIGTAVCSLVFSIVSARTWLAVIHLLGAAIRTPRPRPAGGVGWRRAWQAARAPAVYREVGYALVRFPLSLVQGLLLLAGWSLAVALVTLPAYNWALPLGGAHQPVR